NVTSLIKARCCHCGADSLSRPCRPPRAGRRVSTPGSRRWPAAQTAADLADEHRAGAGNVTGVVFGLGAYIKDQDLPAPGPPTAGVGLRHFGEGVEEAVLSDPPGHTLHGGLWADQLSSNHLIS